MKLPAMFEPISSISVIELSHTLPFILCFWFPHSFALSSSTFIFAPSLSNIIHFYLEPRIK